MRKSFIAGFLTLLPIIVTYIVVVFFISIITAPFEYAVTQILERLHLFETGFAIFSHHQVITFFSRLLIICSVLLLIFLVGWLAAWVIFETLGAYFDRQLKKVPVIGAVYSSTKELIYALYHPPKSPTTRASALVPYPTKDDMTVGIVMGEFTIEMQTYYSVFITSTPHATNGFLCSFPTKDVKLLETGADEALSYVWKFGVESLAKKD